MTLLVQRAKILLVLLASMVAVVLASPAFVQPAHAATVKVNLNCVGGGFAFNASYTGAAKRQYAVDYQYDTWNGSFGGGTFDWQSMGNLTTGSQGIGTSNTVKLGASSPSEITVEVRVNGVIGTARRTC